MANKFHDFDEPINRIGTDSFKWDYEMCIRDRCRKFFKTGNTEKSKERF